MAVIGGQIDQLNGLKSSFGRHSANVEQLMSALRSELDSAYWKGGAADRFRNAWASEYEPALRRLSAALVEAGDEVGRRAQALEQVGS